MGEADFNEDGEISYEEFIPLAVELVGSMYAKMEAEYARQHDEDEAREEASTYLLHGMTKQQVRDRTRNHRALCRVRCPALVLVRSLALWFRRARGAGGGRDAGDFRKIRFGRLWRPLAARVPKVL